MGRFRVSGPRVVNEDTKAQMKDVLTDIQNGKFAKGWILENQANRPNSMRSTAVKINIKSK